MKRVYRHQDNAEYWDHRWSESGEDRDYFEDLTIYPIRYAEMVMTDKSKKALEIGCGLGRVILHYLRQGYRVSGVERSQVAVTKIKERHPDVDARAGDALKLPYDDGEFDVVMAFGVYHNLEQGIETGLAEAARVLSAGGRFCISMRPDNMEMRLNEVYWNWRNRSKRNGERHFHKLLVGEPEFSAMLDKAGLVTDSIHRARNVSLLYRLPFFRNRDASDGSEAARRSKGYRLNAAGRFVDGNLRSAFPYHTANVLVFVGHKR